MLTLSNNSLRICIGPPVQSLKTFNGEERRDRTLRFNSHFQPGESVPMEDGGIEGIE